MMLLMVLLFIITITVLVGIHEFGHYWTARRCGVYIERFSIGFGPTLFSYKTAAGIEFRLAAILLGGYVKMRDSRIDTVIPQDKVVAFDKQSISKRIAIISAGPIANFLVALLIYWIIFQIGVMFYPVKIDGVMPNSMAASLHISSDTELKAIDGIKIENWQDVRLALISAVGNKTLHIAYIPPYNGTRVIMQTVDIQNWKIDRERDDPISAFGFIPQRMQIIPVITKVLSGSAAEQAGLAVGDRIVRFNNQPLDNWARFSDEIQRGKQLNLEIERQGKLIALSLTPVIQQAALSNKQYGFAGITPKIEQSVKKYGIFSALTKSIKQTGFIIKVIARSCYQLFTGSLNLSNLSGPITMAKSADQSASYGIVAYLYFLAFISISLGVINLIPLPTLDGGYLLFLLIEKIKGRPLSENKLKWAYKISFLLIIMLMGIALFNDFSRL